jgi:branched-chain amino acid transport system ATP-binding protein
MSLLAVSDVTIRYGRLTAVREVAFTLAEGEILFITGPNGAGKSSLMRAIAGVTPPAGGRIDFGGAEITGRAPEDIARMGLSMVPEGRDVFGSLSIEENLIVGTGMHTRERGWRARAASALEEVYDTFPILKERRHSQAGLLSGGQQQMLVIGRALMTNPRLIAIDEPSLGLAPNITDQVYERLIGLRRHRKLTLLIVEQSSTRAMMVGGRMILMRGGQILLDGDAQAMGQSEALQAAYFGYAEGEH